MEADQEVGLRSADQEVEDAWYTTRRRFSGDDEVVQ